MHSFLVFSVIALLGVGIGLNSTKNKSILVSIIYNAVSSFLVVSIPVITITVIQNMRGGSTGFLPMVAPVFSLFMFAISLSVWAAARFGMKAKSNCFQYFKKTSHLLVYILALLLLLGFGFPIISYYQDQEFAKKIFRKISYQEVLETRMWLPGNTILGCTYAIVTLQKDASFEPPKQWLSGATWHQTPLRYKNDTTNTNCRNIICNCKKDWNPENYRSLNRALNQPESFYITDKGEPPYDALFQGVIYIYSKKENIAAHVRFGD